MSVSNKSSAALLGIFIFLGLAVLGYTLGNAAIQYKLYDRSVTVKGLSERESTLPILLFGRYSLMWRIMILGACTKISMLKHKASVHF